MTSCGFREGVDGELGTARQQPFKHRSWEKSPIDGDAIDGSAG